MTPADDTRECELFARYWDGTLTPAQQARFEETLRTSGAARDRFRLFNLTAVAAADLGIAAPAPADRPTRRTWLVRAGAGLAAGLAGLTAYRAAAPPAAVRLVAVKGRVVVGGVLAGAGSVLAAGTTVTTADVGAAALLAFPDGSQITLAGDSQATVAGDLHLQLLRGTAAGEVRAAGRAPLTLSTPATAVTAPDGANLSLHANERGTEIGVQDGTAAVATPVGVRLDDVRAGELLTVDAAGGRRKTALPMPPENFAWPVAAATVKDWKVGDLDFSGPEPCVRPEQYFDPFHQAVMAEIRSDHNWTRGFATVHPDSVVRVRYAADRPGPGQVVLVVRGPRSGKSATGCLEINTTFRPAPAGGWADLAVPARDMLNNPQAPGFDGPWVAFLAIFNTYTEDIGLKVAGLEVRRPGRL